MGIFLGIFICFAIFTVIKTEIRSYDEKIVLPSVELLAKHIDMLNIKVESLKEELAEYKRGQEVKSEPVV